MDVTNGFRNIVAWVFVIGLLLLISKSRIGYTFLLYFVLASILIVLAVGSPTITNIFKQQSLFNSNPVGGQQT